MEVLVYSDLCKLASQLRHIAGHLRLLQARTLLASGGVGGLALGLVGTAGNVIAQPSITSLSPSSGAGLSQIFTAMYSDTSGYNDIQEAHMLLQTSLTGTNTCGPRYNVQSNQLYLLQDSGSGWLGPISPGSGQTLTN